VVTVRRAWDGWKKSEADWRPIFLGLLLAMLAILVHGLVDVPYFKNDLSLEFWVLAGLVAAGLRWNPRAKTPEFGLR